MAVHDEDRPTTQDYMHDKPMRQVATGSGGRWLVAVIALALLAAVAYMLMSATKSDMNETTQQTPTTTAPTTQPK